MPMVTVRYWAAAKQAAGVEQERLSAGTLAELLAAVRQKRSAAKDFEALLARSSFLVDGRQASGRAADAVTLSEGAVVEVLPPFAGG
jgi:sulfur-carrier protein